MYIDTHCHLTFPEFDPDRAMVIGNAKKAGVKQFIAPGVDPHSNELVIALAQKYPGVIFPAVGYHPYEAKEMPPVNKLPVKGAVAVGEIGLDYHMYKGEAAIGNKQSQKILFDEQLRLALRNDLPVIMHCRDAFEDFFSVLDNLPSMPRGVIHCFSGGLEDVRMAKERALFVGLDGNITYSKQLQSIIPHIPLEMILLETDAPYLTPSPHRGQRNEPKYIPLIAKTVASIQNIRADAVARQTSVNARTLFRLMI